MSWRNRLWPFSKSAAPAEAVLQVQFAMRGWTEQQPDGELRVWSGPHRSVLSLGTMGTDDWLSTSDSRLREMARNLASSRAGGLIEAHSVPCGKSAAVRLIYKRLQLPAYVYTGMFIIRLQGSSLIWTIVDGECGTTGVRDAVVTSELFAAGIVRSVEDFERSWAQDPYDMTSLGVDRSVLRAISDDEKYDARFPDHPLSRVRRFLDDLCVWVQTESGTSPEAKQ